MKGIAMFCRSWLLFCLLLPVSVQSAAPAFGQDISQRSPCGVSTQPDTVATLTQTVKQVASWIAQPGLAMDAAMGQLAGNTRAYFNPSQWPAIQVQARDARVPVIMYHDIVATKQVFFDVTPSEFEAQLQQIRNHGLTPISVDQLITHLRTSLPLPKQPILLSFDDGYAGHYNYVYPLLKKFGYPALFAIYPRKLDRPIGRPGLTWDQLKEMAADPLVTIAAHSVTHPADLTQLPDEEMEAEVRDSKQILEARLGLPIQYFVYPEGHYNQRVTDAIAATGFSAAFTMNDADEGFAGQSENLLAIKRFGQSSLPQVLSQAWGGPDLPQWRPGFNFGAPVSRLDTVVNNTPFTLIAGGRPITIHAKSRYQVPEILAGTQAIAAVDGGFFSLEFLDSNTMIGPVLSQNTGQFNPGNRGENPRLKGRPLVLISPATAKFIPYDPLRHSTLAGIEADQPGVTDAFVAAAWLVRQGLPQPPEAFGTLFDFNAARHRAFWGINQAGQPQIGVSKEPIGSVDLGIALAKAGFRDAVMLDSGASTSLAYQGESLVGYTPRPVPHVVALVPPTPAATPRCIIAAKGELVSTPSVSLTSN